MTKLKKISAMCVVLLCSGYSLAQEAESASDSKPCKQDVQKFCKNSESKKEIAQCLKKHLAELSKPCKEKIESKIEARKAAREEAVESAKEEVSEECKNVKFKDPKFKECAKERMALVKKKMRNYHQKVLADKKAKQQKEKAQKALPAATSNNKDQSPGGGEKNAN